MVTTLHFLLNALFSKKTTTIIITKRLNDSTIFQIMQVVIMGYTIKIHQRSKSIRSKTTRVKIHPFKIFQSQKPADQNQPESKTTRSKSTRVETNTLLYLFLLQSNIIQMNPPPKIANLKQISFVETTNTNKIFFFCPL